MWSQSLCEILSPYVAELVVYRGEWKPGMKRDAIDAHGLAERLRMGQIDQPVYKDVRLFTTLRDRARTYTMITRDYTRVKFRLKSFFRSRGLSCTGTAVYRPEERVKQLAHFPRKPASW